MNAKCVTKENTISVQRDYSIDNLKAILIVFVLLGHVLNLLRKVPELTSLYYLIYAFHMPCFAFTSGYTAKSMLKDGKFNASRYLSTLWMYFFFRTASYCVSCIYGRGAEFSYFSCGTAP